MIKIDYEIPTNSSGYRVGQFLKWKGYTGQLLQGIKHANGVFCNGYPVRMNTVLQAGDQLSICCEESKTQENIRPLFVPLHILYEDRDILVVDKPAHMSTHVSAENREGTLQNALAGYFANRKEDFVFRCMNRLDTDTSGLTIVAKHEISAAILYKLGIERQIKREYICVVEGAPEEKYGTIDVPIGRVPGKLLKMQVDREHGKKAITHYEVLSSNASLSMLRVWLETGRTHQIRVHMKEIGHPIIGDYLYNPDMKYIDRQALHAQRLTFPHPITGEMLTFETENPFQALMQDSRDFSCERNIQS